MTKEELAEIKQWWGLHSNAGAAELVGDEVRSVISGDIDMLCAIRDFINQAHNDIPKLIAEVERLQEENANVKGILGTILTDIDRAKAEGRPYV